MWLVYSLQFREMLDAYNDETATKDTEQNDTSSIYVLNV